LDAKVGRMGRWKDGREEWKDGRMEEWRGV